MKKKDLRTGVHVWFKESFCCGAKHEKGEEGIIMHIDHADCFLVETIKRKLNFYHELDCVSITKLRCRKAKSFLPDKLFEV